ncbi:Similar to Cyclin-U2-1; acc. no. Q9SHD3 [Pyronema omphalodes CBS 100304]|uniref:Similar to Cyclin-U2-1 acc. no. Q9SHD3 n=1 Tax=Pyronema omphalodes (strain CBS 100304) TaxID=1076935 RepID=U4KTX3_PYROM|nr:Similar to Cyclin-U2-1; acc. no. Q9SHD3 [Pyronema omphalodes CBS 100304]
MSSPFASPPPPYSPEHPHVILDHEKVPTVMADLPPEFHEDTDSPKPRGLRGKDGDIFHLAPSGALTLLSRYVELLVSMTGDLLPTPPTSHPTTPSAERRDSTGDYCFGSPTNENRESTPPASDTDSEAGESVIHHGGVDDTTHYSTIARKFWSKSAPEVPIEDYLFRIQRFCPLSTAVYLAASYYLHRLAIIDRIIPITRLNVHRLLLAALRIAAKTLEDLSYPHERFAKVGGLKDLELSKLEVSFCFLMDFELKVDRSMLQSHTDFLMKTLEAQVLLGKEGLVRVRSNSP